LIRVERLSKSFGGLHAVNDCSFSLQAGRITGLIGPNGAGKTTVFNMIAGFTKPTSGRIFFQEQDVTAASPEQLFHLGIVRTFQIPHEFGRMTVLENLMLVPPGQRGESLFKSWSSWRKVRRQERDIQRKAEQVLAFLDLAHLRDELAETLSGGQKKLLELGRTMMTDAKLVLLDEPAAGVNPTLMAKLARMIQELHQERGYSFCIIEHDMDLIAELCDPVIVLAEGRVLTEGTIEAVRNDERVLEAYLGHRGAQDLEAGGIA